MSEGLKLEELEAYRVELNNAQREGRPCKYRNPRDVFAEDPNRESYLVEKDSEVIAAEQEALDTQAANTTYLSDPGQAVAEEAARIGAADNSTHQNLQEAPNPEVLTTDQETLEDSEAGDETISTPVTELPETVPAETPAAAREGNFPPSQSEPTVPVEKTSVVEETPNVTTPPAETPTNPTS